MGTRLVALALLALAACEGEGGVAPDAAVSPLGEVPSYEQRDGDPAAGWTAMITEGYVGCGVPKSAFDQVSGPAPLSMRLPERAGGPSAELPFNLTAFETATGVEVIAPNCLQCHAETLNGALVIGLGNHTADYTDNLSTAAEIAGGLVDDPTEHAEWQRWRDRVVAVADYTVTKTVGVNPADNLAAVLFAHRDPETLTWSEEPRFELPPRVVVPVDVPPWWRMAKKHAMFYVAAGRGDHARIMMTASTLCVESVDEARAIDAYFPDVRAFIASLTPPAWPGAVDEALAATGKDVFAGNCAACHGTYGEDGEYPNLVIDLDEVATDPTMAEGVAQFAGASVDWFNNSFYGELSFLAPARGYLAPPLDGVWATAPFLHNGSVPSLRALLDSSLRPDHFILSRNTSAYDEATMGWPFTVTGPQASEDDYTVRVQIYDTGNLGYGNQGHTYGDVLDEAERTALLEYLKTI